jgi:hypothetical protein
LPKGAKEPVRVKGQTAWKDDKGHIWSPDPTNHGGAHWDVVNPQIKGAKGHINVTPEGGVRGQSEGSTAGARVVVGAAGAAAGAGPVWWGLKALSPACGPFAVACAFAL